ncbi:hypothetical protein DFH09DRAFT_1089141 [Mycena vulgaris]|nr:hypothetical protein DFH09DRAFT_1089141 [Mycena vulgaris]
MPLAIELRRAAAILQLYTPTRAPVPRAFVAAHGHNIGVRVPLYKKNFYMRERSSARAKEFYIARERVMRQIDRVNRPRHQAGASRVAVPLIFCVQPARFRSFLPFPVAIKKYLPHTQRTTTIKLSKIDSTLLGDLVPLLLSYTYVPTRLCYLYFPEAALWMTTATALLLVYIAIRHSQVTSCSAQEWGISGAGRASETRSAQSSAGARTIGVIRPQRSAHMLLPKHSHGGLKCRFSAPSIFEWPPSLQ